MTARAWPQPTPGWRVLVGVLVLVAWCARPVEAQRRRPAPVSSPGTLTIGVSGGWTRDAADAFAEDAICPDTDARSWAARIGYRLAGALIAQAVVARHTGHDEVDCVNGLIPPVPDQGPHSRTFEFFDAKYRAYPFVSTEARLALELPVGRSMRARAFGGMGAIWSKDIPYRLLGAEVRFGGGSMVFFGETERWWHNVPRREVEQNFLDGVLVSQNEDIVDAGYRSTLIRLGLELSTGR